MREKYEDSPLSAPMGYCLPCMEQDNASSAAPSSSQVPGAAGASQDASAGSSDAAQLQQPHDQPDMLRGFC